MSTAMSAELVSALNASFAAGGWRLVGVFVDRHVESDGVTSWTKLHATLQAEHAARRLLHVWVLEGIEGQAYTSARLTAGGCAVETTDATLIARLVAAMPLAIDAMQAALVASVTAPLGEVA